MVKYGVAVDSKFFTWIEANANHLRDSQSVAAHFAITQSCQLKAAIVERDEREESGQRMILNYGHTFGHAFETSVGYGTWLHGEAVSAGMTCAARLAERLGLLAHDDVQRQTQLLASFGLPTAPPPGNIDEWLSIMRRDKKSLGGRHRLVLPRRLGKVEVVDGVDEVLIRSVLS